MEIFSVRLNHITPKSAGARQMNSGVLPIKIRIESKRENRKQKQIHSGYSCTKEVFEALFPKLGSTITREMKRIQNQPEYIELKRLVEEKKNEWYSVVKGITMSNNPLKIWTLRQVEDIVLGNKTSLDKIPFNSRVELLEYHWELLLNKKKNQFSKSSTVRHKSAKNSFLRYKHYLNEKDKEEKQPFDIENPPKLKYYEIDKEFLNGWEEWLRDPEKQWNYWS